MVESPDKSSETPVGGKARGGGRGRSRGGLGKYLRASGRGRGRGRPAVFNERLLLEGEGEDEEDEEEAAAKAAKYSRRQLGTNADRYAEPEAELGSDGEPIIEPEVDLSSFLQRQKLADTEPALSAALIDDEDDVDTTLSHIGTRPVSNVPRKGKIKQVEWDEDFEELSREKASAEATWDLKSRFRSKSERLRSIKPPVANRHKTGDSYVTAPPLPLPDGSAPPLTNPKDKMQDFLDDLLA